MIWDQLKYFKRTENWGDPDKIDEKLLLILDAFRDEIGIPLYVSCALSVPGSHDARYSSHYPDDKGLCYAVDVIPLLSYGNIALLDCYIIATRYPFNGIGVYPDWRYSRISPYHSRIERGGLHLDTSPYRHMKPMRCAGQWIGYMSKAGQEYIGVTKCNLKKHGLI